MYEQFALVYDEFMDTVPYEAWAQYLTGILKENGITDGLLLDLGCGTGTLTELLADSGYDMIGIDGSETMLEAALEKKIESGHDILYLQQDMRSFELYGTVRGIICVCDCLNYLLEEEELLQVFRLANNYLDPGGLFLFDMSTADKYRKIGDKTIAESTDDAALIWENSWFEEDQINEYELTLFVRGEDGRYDMSRETHVQRAYRKETILSLLEKAGLRVVSSGFGCIRGAEEQREERLFVIAREQGKTGNV